MSKIYISLQYYSQELQLITNKVDLYENISTSDDLIQLVGQYVQLNQKHFYLTQKKDGYNKRILPGWNLAFYDLEQGDQIQIHIKQEEEETEDFKQFIFKVSNTSSMLSNDSDYMNNQSILLRTQSKPSFLTPAEEIEETIQQQSNLSIMELESLLKRAIKECPDVLTRYNQSGWAPLHYLAYYSCSNFVLILKKNNFQCNINLTTVNGWTPLQIVVRQEDEDGTSALLSVQGLDVSQITKFGTALHIACKIKNKNIVLMLLQNKADPLQLYKKDMNGKNCYEVCNQEIQQLLLSNVEGNQQHSKINQFSQIKPVICKGPVVTPGDFRWQIKNRFMVLNPVEGTIKRFSNQNFINEKPKATIFINNIQKIESQYDQIGLSKKYKFIRVLYKQNELIFGTESQAQNDRWVAMLRQAIIFQKNKQSKIQGSNIFLDILEVTIEISELRRQQQQDPNLSNKISYDYNYIRINIRRSDQIYQYDINLYYYQYIGLAQKQDVSLDSPQKKINPQKDQNFQNASFLNAEEISVPIKKSEVQKRVKYSDFEIIKIVGQGQFGVVFLAKYLQSDEVYALKVMNKARLIRKKQIRYAVNESTALKITDHPFILKMSYAFQTPKHLYMALEYCPASDLYSILTKLNRFRQSMALFYICEILLGLEYLHSKNIIFRDLKPENILVGRDGHVKIADFGLCKLNVQYEVESKSFCGSPAYMSPESLNRKTAGKYFDQYALGFIKIFAISEGIVIYELLTGLPPFLGNNLELLYASIQEGEVIFPAYISPEAKDLILQFLEKDVKKRLTFSDAKQHPFFKGVDWEKVVAKGYKPPIPAEKTNKQNNTSFKANLFQDEDYVAGDKFQMVADFEYAIN